MGSEDFDRNGYAVPAPIPTAASPERVTAIVLQIPVQIFPIPFQVPGQSVEGACAWSNQQLGWISACRRRRALRSVGRQFRGASARSARARGARADPLEWIFTSGSAP